MLIKTEKAMKIQTGIILGDCREELKRIHDNSIDLIFTSPPYADSRKNTYGGISPDEYVEWFLPVAKELLRVLKPTGTFILNIKEKAAECNVAKKRSYIKQKLNKECQ